MSTEICVFFPLSFVLSHMYLDHFDNTVKGYYNAKSNGVLFLIRLI